MPAVPPSSSLHSSIHRDHTISPGNTSTFVDCPNDFPVYQGDLPPLAEVVTYDLCRAEGDAILTVEGLTPILSKRPINSGLDSAPSFTERSYAAVARDLAGNRSLQDAALASAVTSTYGSVWWVQERLVP